MRAAKTVIISAFSYPLYKFVNKMRATKLKRILLIGATQSKSGVTCSQFDRHEHK